MECSLSYYANKSRMALDIYAQENERGFRFFCIDGTVTKTNNKYNVQTPVATVIVVTESEINGRNMMRVFTTDARYKEYNGGTIPFSKLFFMSIYYSLYLLLKQKHEVTHNDVCMTLGSDKAVVDMKIVDNDDGVTQSSCCIRGINGEVTIVGEEGIKDILNNCNTLKSFSYSVVNPDIERTVTVSKNIGEIMREIARYLNRTIVVASFDEDTAKEFFFGSFGVVGIYTPNGGKSYSKRVSSVSIKQMNPFCVYSTTDGIVDIMKKRGLQVPK